MTYLSKHNLIRALLCQPVDRIPVWFMRQAGRYLPEYRKLREKETNFMRFCKTPALAAEATLQPLKRFDLDAAIIFSDILTVPDAMGVALQILPGEGPVIEEPIRTMTAVDRLKIPRVENELAYVFEAIERVVTTLDNKLPLIGFSGSPWTLACYLIEGKTSKTFYQAKTLLYRQPEVLSALLERLTTVIIQYLNAQVKAGAKALMLFDTWGGILTSAAYQQFSLHYLDKIAQSVVRDHNGEKIPLVFFTKGSGHWLDKIVTSGCDAIGLDWTIDLSQARTIVGNKVALQGNLDPALLLSDPAAVETEVHRILQGFDYRHGYVFNLGHGVDPQAKIENVEAMLKTVRAIY